MRRALFARVASGRAIGRREQRVFGGELRCESPVALESPLKDFSWRTDDLLHKRYPEKYSRVAGIVYYFVVDVLVRSNW